MAVKTFTTGEVLTAADTNTYLNNGGLVFIKQQTIGTAVSSVAVTSAFSSAYANYRVVIAHPQSSNNDGLRIQFGATVTGYYGTLFYYIYTGGTSGYSSFNNAANMDVALSDTTANTFTTFDVGNPNAASRTYINGTYWGRGFTGYFSGTEVSSTQHTAFTILPSTGGGTLTGGKIYVYGYRNE